MSIFICRKHSFGFYTFIILSTMIKYINHNPILWPSAFPSLYTPIAHADEQPIHHARFVQSMLSLQATIFSFNLLIIELLWAIIQISLIQPPWAIIPPPSPPPPLSPLPTSPPLPPPVPLTKGLVTNYGEGGYKTGGVACEVLPLRNRGGGGKSFSHAEGGAQKVLG